jgi:hypothetical protein
MRSLAICGDRLEPLVKTLGTAQIELDVKLLKIPPQMPDEVAAVFSIGAQTTYSMIRKLKLEPILLKLDLAKLSIAIINGE